MCAACITRGVSGQTQCNRFSSHPRQFSQGLLLILPSSSDPWFRGCFLWGVWSQQSQVVNWFPGFCHLAMSWGFLGVEVVSAASITCCSCCLFPQLMSSGFPAGTFTWWSRSSTCRAPRPVSVEWAGGCFPFLLALLFVSQGSKD